MASEAELRLLATLSSDVVQLRQAVTSAQQQPHVIDDDAAAELSGTPSAAGRTAALLDLTTRVTRERVALWVRLQPPTIPDRVPHAARLCSWRVRALVRARRRR